MSKAVLIWIYYVMLSKSPFSGPNCKLPGKDGEIISHGDVKIKMHGQCTQYCFCRPDAYRGIVAECHSDCTPAFPPEFEEFEGTV